MWQSQLKTTPDNPVLLETGAPLGALKAPLSPMLFFGGGRADAALFACVLLLGGCAPTLVNQDGEATGFPDARNVFEVSGRLSARHKDDALAAGFRWRHNGDHDEMELASPLGQLVAQLSGVPGDVQLRSADGHLVNAADWPALTARGLGWPLPIDGLAYWIQGVPRADATFDVERDANGLPTVLRQDGWTITYQAFVAGQDGGTRPARLTLSYPDVEVRVVIDGWQ